MKNFYLTLFLCLCFNFSKAQTVNIPDINFKNVLVNSICADTNGDGILDGDVDLNDDGEIQNSEAQVITWLSVKNIGSDFIDSLEGMESFVGLLRLDLDFIQVRDINLSGNTALQELKIDGGGGGLETLDLSLNTE